MTLFSPLFLFWLLILLPVIVFFYLLKLKRREVTISSVLLWNHLVKDVQANAPFQKLKKNLLLFLQLLIAILAILALARPALFVKSLGGKNVVMILDGSASMQSRDAKGTRFDEAKETALRMVNQMRGGDKMMVVLATNRTHRLTSLTTNQNELRRAIRQAEPRDTTTNLRDALLLASSAVASSSMRGERRIYVLSDGAFGDLEDLDTRGAGIEFVKVGSRSENVGIVAMDVRRMFRDEGGYQMFVAVRNYSGEPKKGNIEFYRDEALIDVRPVDLPAADKTDGFAEKAEVFTNLPEANGILRARLDIKDDLEADNEAYAQLSTRREVNVLLVSEGNVYLENALNVDPNVQVQKVAPSGYTGQSGFDVVVFEGEPPSKVGPGSHLYIDCGGDSAPVQLKSKITEATILDWRRAHPVMRYVKLNNLNMSEARVAEVKPWGIALAEHEGGVVIAIGEKSGVKSAYVGFPLLRTDFPLRVAFPIFFNNVVQWLAAKPGRTEGLQLMTGQSAPIEVPPSTPEITVTDPDGKKYPVKPEGKLAYFAATERRGVYIATGKGVKQEFAMNLLSRDESQTQPKDALKLGRRPVLAGTGTVKTAHEFWRWLVLLALLVLGIEWWVYHKRI